MKIEKNAGEINTFYIFIKKKIISLPKLAKESIIKK